MNQSRGQVSLHLLLTVFLGLGMLLFGVLAIVAYRDNERIHKNLDLLVSKATSEARTQQKASDDEANRKANEIPFKTYTASAVDGSFQLQIPKNWSIYAGKNASPIIQLDLMSDPEVVDHNLGNKAINTHAFRLQLHKRTQTEVIKTYDEKIKKKKVSSRGVQVSGQAATWLEGEFDDQRHNGIVVIVPVRDKTMVITTDTHQYISEFNKILASSKIIP